MKCFIASLFLFFIGVQGLVSQSEGCITDQNDTFFKRLESNLKRSNETVEKGFVTRFVPINFFIVEDTDGSNSMDDTKIINDLCKLNERYLEADILFYIDDITYINNTNLNHRPRLTTSVNLMRQMRNNKAMNIFLVTEILQNNGTPSGAAGYYSGGNNDFVVMLKNQLGNESFTIEHEIGHFFSLAHPHVGWEGDISQGSTNGGYHPMTHGDTVRIQIITGSTQAGSVEVELVDRSNCTTAADRICDTPPDYGFGQSCGCCTMVYDVWDRNGDKIEPMIDNVMSYSNGCDPFLFSAEQIITMQSDFDSPSRAYLRTGEVAEFNPISSSVNIISPVNDQIFENFNGVLLEWEPIAEAEEYRVFISVSQQLEFTTTDNELYLTNLQPNKFYFVDVFAINKFGTGCHPITRRLFQTGSGSTSVNETSSINEINVFPNPVYKGQDLTVNYNSQGNFSSTVKLISINGQLVWNKQTQIIRGENKMIISSNGLNTGLYFLELHTTEGVIIEKIIIE